jgi:YggT family protein
MTLCGRTTAAPLLQHHTPPQLSLVTSFLILFGAAIDLLGRALVVIAGVLAIVALVDWLVRTRRLNPFNPIARFFRRVVDPAIAPVERRVVRAGGMPHAAPWWALVAVVLGGIVLLAALRFIQGQLLSATLMAQGGPRSIFALLVHWTFAILQIAIFARVISSWLRVSPYAWWVRWSYALSEPILRPLRAVIPPLGMIDITPIVAYFAISWLIEPLVLRAIRGG